MEMDLNRMFAMIAWRKLGSAIFVWAVMMTVSNTPVLVGQVPTRFWSDNSGTFSTEAQLLKINSATVTLRKTNQVVIEVPFSRLSQIDLDFVKNEIKRLNGIAPAPAQQFGPAQSTQPNVSSRNTGEPAFVTPKSSSRSNSYNNSLQPKSETDSQPPLRYAAKPKEFHPEPMVAADPILPDSIPAVIPTKDSVTSPPSDVARLVPAAKPQKEFSLGHPGAKKAPIILKSPPQVASTTKEPQRKSLLELQSTFKEDSQSEKTSFESSPSSPNNLRSANSFPPLAPKNSATPTPPSTNDLRSQPFVFDPKPALPTEISPNDNSKQPLNGNEKTRSFGPKPISLKRTEEPSNSFQPPVSRASKTDRPGSLTTPSQPSPKNFPTKSNFKFDKPTTEFSPKPLDSRDPAIVILPNKESDKEPEPNLADVKTKSSKTSASKHASAAFSFDEGPNEVAHVFSRPPAFGPRKTSFETSANPGFVANDESLAELPPRFQTVVSRLVNSKNPTEIRAGLSEIRTTWPSQRFSSLVDVVQACVKAPEAATRILAIETLALRDPEKSLEHILSGVDDDSIDVRERTHSILEKLSDPAIIPALAKRLDSDQRQRVAGALSKLGPVAEPHVIPFTTNASIDVQLSACNILGSIGTKKGIKALQTVMANSKQARVRLQASNAIDRISQRLVKSLK